MIERAISERDYNDRFYKHNEKLAKSWENLVEKYEGKIEGIVNGFILEFKAEFSIKKYNVKVNSIRQISNKNAGISTGFLMTKNTEIILSPVKGRNTKWKLSPYNSLSYFINRLKLNTKIFSFDEKYMIVSSNRIFENELIAADVWPYLSNIAELRGIEQNKDSLKLEYFNFLGAATIEKLVHDLIKLYGS